MGISGFGNLGKSTKKNLLILVLIYFFWKKKRILHTKTTNNQGVSHNHKKTFLSNNQIFGKIF